MNPTPAPGAAPVARVRAHHLRRQEGRGALAALQVLVRAAQHLPRHSRTCVSVRSTSSLRLQQCCVQACQALRCSGGTRHEARPRASLQDTNKSHNLPRTRSRSAGWGVGRAGARLGAAKVGQRDCAARAHEHVLRLEVAMDHLVVVQVVQRLPRRARQLWQGTPNLILSCMLARLSHRLPRHYSQYCSHAVIQFEQLRALALSASGDGARRAVCTCLARRPLSPRCASGRSQTCGGRGWRPQPALHMSRKYCSASGSGMRRPRSSASRVSTGPPSM